jgi:hypothetical protein
MGVHGIIMMKNGNRRHLSAEVPLEAGWKTVGGRWKAGVTRPVCRAMRGSRRGILPYKTPDFGEK